MKDQWLYLNKVAVETERLQCEQEGRDLASLEAEFAQVMALDLEELDLKVSANQPAAEALLDKTIALPIRPGYAFKEPSDLEGIRALRPARRPKLPVLARNTVQSNAQLEDKIYGAWAGRCVGCLLGKPVEGWKRAKMTGYLKDIQRWPLSDYFRLDVATADALKKYQLEDQSSTRYFVDLLDAMPEDDDTNYTVAALAVLSKYGAQFTSEDVARFWLADIPLLKTCTAERVAHRNLGNGIPPPHSAVFRNPYREWIGAQIRADFWGYAAAGDPERAADFAWRDASLSHVKNGIYGAMWVAAMTAAAFVTDDMRAIIEAGLGQIPAHCRLADAIDDILEWHEVEVDYDTAIYRIHELWNENRAYDWCHTIPNAMIVAVALMWGEGDYAKTICRAVQACFDTDCNGATTGSILGILQGRKNLPARWVEPINDTLHTGVAGYEVVKLAELTRESLRVIQNVAAR